MSKSKVKHCTKNEEIHNGKFHFCVVKLSCGDHENIETLNNHDNSI